MPERFRPMQPEQRATPEAVIGIRKEELWPEVRSYVENLTAQAGELYARKDTLSREELKTLAELTKRLTQALEFATDTSPETLTTKAHEFLGRAKGRTQEIANPRLREGALWNVSEAEASAGLFDQAAQTIGMIVDEDIKIQAILSLAESKSIHGVDPSVDYNNVLQFALGRDSEERQELIDGIVRDEAQAGLFALAKETAAQSAGFFERLLNLAVIAKKEAKAGKDASSTILVLDQDLAQEEPPSDLKVAILCDLALAQTYMGQDPSSRLAAAEQSARSVRDLDEQIASFLLLIDTWLALSRPDEAIRLAIELPPGRSRAVAFRSLGVWEAKNGKNSAVSFQASIAYGSGIEHKPLRFKNIQATADAMIKVGAYHEVEKAVEQLDEPMRSSVYSKMAQALADRNDIVQAEAALVHVGQTHVGLREEAHVRIALAEARSCRFDEAYRRVRSLTDPYPRSIAYGRLARIEVRFGRDPLPAIDLAREAVFGIEEGTKLRDKAMKALAGIEANIGADYLRMAERRTDMVDLEGSEDS